MAWSWTKKRVNPSSGRPFGRMSYVKSAALWSAWNSATTTLHGPRSSPGRYLRMRYEDFIDDPVSSLSRVLSFVDEPAVDLPIPGGDGVPALPMTRRHSIGGNPAKFVDGLIRFKTDTTWREEMPRLGRSVVTALTWPLLMKYGYPLRVSS